MADPNQLAVRAYLVNPATVPQTNNQGVMQLALFDSNGTPHPLPTVMPVQAVFSGADVTALKVELNALRTKLINAGLMAAS